MSATQGLEPKPDWAELPEALREKIGIVVGAPIETAETVHGGFGPTATFILRTADKRKVFCKGAQPGHTDEGRAALLRERRNFETFAELSKFAPAYLGATEHADWHIVLLECLDRAIEVPPWTVETFRRIITTLADFHRATPPRAERLLQSAPHLFKHEHGWARLRDSRASRDRFVSLFEDAAETHRWFEKNIDVLVELETQAYGVEGPQSWIHQDIRSDNLLYVAGGNPKIVDWPYLAFGPTLIDVAFFLPSVAGEGGPASADGLKDYQHVSGLRFDADEIAIAATTVAGFFGARAGEPDLPLLPRLRWVQRLQLFPALDWACELVGLECPVKKLRS